MTTLVELKRLLSGPQSRIQGEVVRIVPGQIHVSTRGGVVIVERGYVDATAYRVGDRVTVSDAGIVGRSSRDDPPVYIV